jgi:hypothetical protein
MKGRQWRMRPEQVIEGDRNGGRKTYYGDVLHLLPPSNVWAAPAVEKQQSVFSTLRMSHTPSSAEAWPSPTLSAPNLTVRIS